MRTTDLYVRIHKKWYLKECLQRRVKPLRLDNGNAAIYFLLLNEYMYTIIMHEWVYSTHASADILFIFFIDVKSTNNKKTQMLMVQLD